MRIYCDGGCSGNGKSDARAGSGVAIYIDDENPILMYGKYLLGGTNNTSELEAFLKSLKLAESGFAKGIEDITIYADSKYAMNCVTVWAYGWKKKGWTKKKGDILNLDIIKEAHIVYERIKNQVKVEHIKGHSGDEGNELADRMTIIARRELNNSYKIYEYGSIVEVLGIE